MLYKTDKTKIHNGLQTGYFIVLTFSVFILPNGLRWLEVNFIIDFMHAEWTVHLSWDQPLLDAGYTEDMLTRKTQRIMRVSQTHWT